MRARTANGRTQMGHEKVYFCERNVRRKMFGDQICSFSGEMRAWETRKCAFVYNFSLKLMCGCVDVRVKRSARDDERIRYGRRY